MTQFSSRGLRKAPVKKVAHEVDDDRHHEQQGCPVVDLPHEQAAADVEGDVQRGVVGLAHRDADERV
jgi:hypothetical protein